MDASSRERHSRPCETNRRIWRSRFRLGLGVIGAVALMSFSDTLCLGATSSKHIADVKAEVPLELYNGYLIVVKATIGPMKDVNVLLGTGTSPSVISQEIAHRLKLRGKTASMQTLKGTIQTQIVILPRIQIGPMDADSVEVVVQDLRFIEQSLGISLGELLDWIS